MVRYEQLKKPNSHPNSAAYGTIARRDRAAPWLLRWSTIGNGTHYWRLLLKLT